MLDWAFASIVLLLLSVERTMTSCSFRMPCGYSPRLVRLFAELYSNLMRMAGFFNAVLARRPFSMASSLAFMFPMAFWTTLIARR